MLHWRSSSGRGGDCVSLFFDYKGSQYIKKRIWHTKVHILQLTVGCLNATICRNTQKAKLEIGTDRYSQTRQNPHLDTYRYGFGPLRGSRLDFWTGLALNWTVLAVPTQTAGRLPGPVGNTIYTLLELLDWYFFHISWMKYIYTPILYL